ncbi:MAG: thioredoxin family protein, partial [Verrucomicrobiales bacterium]
MLPTIATLGLLAACGGKKVAQVPGNPYDEIPESLRPNYTSEEQGTPVGELKAINEGGVKIGEFVLPGDDEIVWSDERNPNADINFEKPFLKPQRKASEWDDSYTEARRRAQRTGKPLLMWFTDNGATPSPLCKALSSELFSKPEFRKWAEKNVVRLRLDLSAGKSGN